MKNLSKHCVSIFLSILMIFAVLPMSASATNYSGNYWEYPEPTRTLSSGCSGDDVKWFQSAINHLVIQGDINIPPQQA